MTADICVAIFAFLVIYGGGQLFLSTPWGITLGCYVTLAWGFVEGLAQRMRERMGR